MKIDYFGNQKLQFVEKIFHEVSESYLDHLNAQDTFRGKIDNLIVRIIENCDSDLSTEGLCHSNLRQNPIIVLNVNTNDSEKFIGFIIAHELAHLLLINSSDLFGISGKASDKSTNISAIIRMKDNNQLYGQSFEELVADYIADYIISKLSFDDNTSQYFDDYQLRNNKRRIISKFELIFGEPLDKFSKLDYYVEKDSKFYFNFFWISIFSFSFNNIIEIYDNSMGKYAFQNLNSSIDDFFSTGSNKKFELINKEINKFEEKIINKSNINELCLNKKDFLFKNLTKELFHLTELYIKAISKIAKKVIE